MTSSSTFTAAEVATAGINSRQVLEHKALSAPRRIWNSTARELYYSAHLRMLAEKINAHDMAWVAKAMLIAHKRLSIGAVYPDESRATIPKSLCSAVRERGDQQHADLFGRSPFSNFNSGGLGPLAKALRNGKHRMASGMMDNFAHIPGNISRKRILKSDLDNLYIHGCRPVVKGRH